MAEELGNSNSGSGKKLGSRPPKREKRMKENEYVVASADQKNKSALVQFHAVPSQLRVAEIVLGQGKFPFKTTSDIFRFCLKYGIDHLLHVEPPASSLISYAIMETERLKDEIYLQEQAKPVEMLEYVVGGHLREGTAESEFQALGIVLTALERARRIKDKVWRERTVKVIEKKFDSLIKRRDEIVKSATEKVSMNPLDMQEEEEAEVVEEEGE